MDYIFLIVYKRCVVVKARGPLGENVGLGQVLRKKAADRNDVVVVTAHFLRVQQKLILLMLKIFI